MGLSGSGKVSAPLAGWTVTLEADVVRKEIPVKNIVGVLEGAGPLADQAIVVGAHYDHLGYGDMGSRAQGEARKQIHHGADDNGSGTTALMEIARHFGKIKDRQGRRLVFIAFTAEESGLIGSAYYCRHPLFPLKDTTTMVNMDQVGRLQDDKLLVGGVGSAREFAALIDRLNQKHRYALVKELSGTAPTDNASFNARQVPVFWFFTGFHEQYHRPTDRLEIVNVPGLGKIVGLVADVVTEVATIPARPTYVKTSGFDRSKTLWSSAPSIGTVPDFNDRASGMLLEDVVKGTPAERAGLKKGDRIIAVGSKKIAGPRAFVTLARTLKVGESVDIIVDNGGQARTVKLQLDRPPAGFTDPHFGFIANLTDLKNGILITDIAARSTAAQAGLKTGDRIVAISGQAIVDQAGYFAILRNIQPGDMVTVTVMRNGKRQEVRVPAARDRNKTPKEVGH